MIVDIQVFTPTDLRTSFGFLLGFSIWGASRRARIEREDTKKKKKKIIPTYHLAYFLDILVGPDQGKMRSYRSVAKVT